MAQIRGSIERALIRFPGIDLSKTKLIGWGAGQAFTDYYPLVPLPVEYTICPYPENQGRTIHGIEVRPPEALLQESREDILIVIFAAHYHEVIRQIREQWGDYRAIGAVAFDNDTAHLRELTALLPVVSSQPGLKRASTAPPHLGIFMQGPIYPFTPLAACYNRTKYPGAHLLLATWEGQDEKLVEACRPWFDEIIFLSEPPIKSHDPRNHVIFSSRMASERLKQIGARYSVRCRSDSILTGSFYTCIDRMFEDGDKNKGKIGIFLGPSWAYLPFHFSDKLIVSRAEDMVQFWSMPFDERPASAFSVDPSAHFLEFRDRTFEHYIWTHHARSMGYPTETLEDSYRFAHARLLPIDKDASMLSLRHFSLFDMRFQKRLTHSLESWEESMSDIETTAERMRQISASPRNIADLFRNNVW